jgi:hypothetical protein
LELIGNAVTTLVCVAAYVVTKPDGSSGAGLAIIGAMAALLAGLVPPLVKLKRGERPLSSKLPRFFGRSERTARWLDLVRQTEDHMSAFFQGHPAVFVLGSCGRS